MIDFGVYEVRPAAYATAKKVFKCLWVDKEKGDEVRSRLTCCDYNNKKKDGLFASTPSASGSRLIDAIAAKTRLRSLVLDVSVAFLHVVEEEDDV